MHGTGVPVRRSLGRFVDVTLALALAACGFSIAAAQGLAVLACVGWLALAFAERGRAPGRNWPLLAPQVALVAVAVVTALAAVDPLTGLREIRAEWMPPVLFYVCVDRWSAAGRARRLVDVLIGAGFVMALLGVGQVAIRGIEFRVQGTLGHFMTYSGVLMLFALFALGRLLCRRDRVVVTAWRWAAFALMVAALVLTQTRTAWVGFAVGAALLVALRDRRLLLLLPAAALVVWLVAPEPARERVRSLVEGRDVTAAERLYMWRAGLDVVRDFPLTGVGPGNLPQVYTPYKHPGDPWLASRPFSHLHATPLQIAAERGLPGLAVWLWLWVAWYRDAVRRWRGSRGEPEELRMQLAAGLAAVSAFLVAGLTEFNYGDTEVLYVAVFAMSLAYAARGPVDAP